MVQLRPGDRLEIRGHPLEFSYWPVRQRRRFGLHTMIYAADPWAVIDSAVVDRCSRDSRSTAQSFVRQAQEYNRAAEQARAIEAKPVLHYYSFMNLVKALALSDGRSALLSTRSHHGLTPTVAATAIDQAEIRAFPSSGSVVNVYDELLTSVSGAGFGRTVDLPVQTLMAQSVFGHRLWTQAARENTERFIQIVRVAMMKAEASREVWINVSVREGDRTRRGWSVGRLLTESGLGAEWEPVTGTVDEDGVPLRIFQQSQPLQYSQRVSDAIMALVARVRPLVWRSLFTARPFRQYYLYLSPSGEVRLPQLASIYALMFYLASLTRYEPTKFLRALESGYGAFLREFLASQPQQFVFGMAGEFKEQEVSKASAL